MKDVTYEEDWLLLAERTISLLTCLYYLVYEKGSDLRNILSYIRNQDQAACSTTIMPLFKHSKNWSLGNIAAAAHNAYLQSIDSSCRINACCIVRAHIKGYL